MGRLVEYLYTGEYSYPAATTVSSNSPSIGNRERILNSWPSHEESGTLNFVAHLDIIDVAEYLDINPLATKAVEYFWKDLMEIPESFAFLYICPSLFSYDNDARILVQYMCIEATRNLFGPGLAVGEEKRQLLDKIFARSPVFANRVLSSCLTIAVRSSKKRRFPDSDEDDS